MNDPRSRAARGEYDAWHRALDVDAAADTPWHQLARRHLVLERDLAGRRVLEIACGRGGFAMWVDGLSTRPARYVAADFAESAVRKASAHARARDLTGVCWCVADAERLPHPNACFDTVLSFETIEHVPFPQTALDEMARVLAPGGRLVLTTPNYLGTMGLYRAYLRLAGRPYTEEGQPINHVMVLPRTRRMVARSGLRITTVDAIGHYLPIPRHAPVRLAWADRLGPLLRWTGLHSLVIAEKASV